MIADDKVCWVEIEYVFDDGGMSPGEEVVEVANFCVELVVFQWHEWENFVRTDLLNLSRQFDCLFVGKLFAVLHSLKFREMFGTNVAGGDH